MQYLHCFWLNFRIFIIYLLQQVFFPKMAINLLDILHSITIAKKKLSVLAKQTRKAFGYVSLLPFIVNRSYPKD
jgi:hypothetical protein